MMASMIVMMEAMSRCLTRTVPKSPLSHAMTEAKYRYLGQMMEKMIAQEERMKRLLR